MAPPNKNDLSRTQRRRQLPQKGYTQLLQAEQGRHLARARAEGLDISAKHCFDLCRALKGRTASNALNFLERVINLREAVPYTYGGGNKKRAVGGARKAGHRRGIGPGRYPAKAAAAMINLIENAMSNAAHQFEEEVVPEDMTITHIAAHRGEIRRGWRPRARGRTTPSNNHLVGVELFLEDVGASDIIDEMINAEDEDLY